MSSLPPVKHDDDKDHSSERWLVSYADFITLMFAFFAVLYATSQKDMEKSKELQESIKRYLIKAGAFGDSGPQISQGVKGNTPIEPPIQSFNPSKPESVRLLDEAETFVEENLSEADRKKYISDITSDDWGVRIVIPSAALFAPGSEKFRADAMPFLAKLGSLIQKTRRKVLIEGHVSENETGSFRSTWDFASARSVNMLRYIQKKEDLSTEMLASASLADSRPLFHDHRKSLNSRLEIVLLNQDFEF
jgi:chemotaxis protein MotB